jgi:hypothetical protein
MNKVSIISGYLACALWSAMCSAQSLEKLSACTSVTDERARLKCYDDEMVRLGLKRPAAVAKAPVATSTTTAAAAAAKKPAVSEDFGLEGQALRKKKSVEAPSEAEPTALNARVKAVSERALGELRIELDNGQVWIETEKHAGTLIAAGESVTVKPGRMGSYFLTRQSGPTVRVKRLQ